MNWKGKANKYNEEVLSDKSQSTDFMSTSKELGPSGTLNEDKSYKFEFRKFDKSFESYYGSYVKLVYSLGINRS